MGKYTKKLQQLVMSVQTTIYCTGGDYWQDLFCCPRELVSVVHPRELVTHSRSIENCISVRGYKRMKGLVTGSHMTGPGHADQQKKNSI